MGSRMLVLLPTALGYPVVHGQDSWSGSNANKHDSVDLTDVLRSPSFLLLGHSKNSLAL